MDRVPFGARGIVAAVVAAVLVVPAPVTQAAEASPDDHDVAARTGFPDLRAALWRPSRPAGEVLADAAHAARTRRAEAPAPVAPADEPDDEPVPVQPDWLGVRMPEVGPDGYAIVPPELVDRTFVPTVEVAPPPPDDQFHATVSDVPDDVAARSTWHPACPVALADLAYLQVSYWGMDGANRTGELIAARDVADDLVTVFAALHTERFPLEELRVTSNDELHGPPTGDTNNSAAFVCRRTVSGSRWSEHAYGTAVDLNPFHNPYVRGRTVVPAQALAYIDRADVRPGMVVAGDPVTQAFAAIGWGWGGDWARSHDPMHFSRSGR